MSLLDKITSVCRDLSPDCRKAARAQSDLLDHRLPWAKRIGLRLHLLICKWCRRYGRHIRFLREAALEHGDELAEAAPRKLSERSRERLKRRLKEEM